MDSTWMIIIILAFLTEPVTACTSRRDLVDLIINKKLQSAPQSANCVINVNLTKIQYETLSVDTQRMQFSSRVKIEMEWIDPDLASAWSDTGCTFGELMLPVNKIWTPDLTVENAVYMSVKPISNDILVKSDGTVKNNIAMYITVVCRINLFTYPFVEGECPVAINGWSRNSCELQVKYGLVLPVGSGQGEWETVGVELSMDKNRSDHNYLHVKVSYNPFKALVSLVLPSALIMVADLVSFALPLDMGKRSSFKITLVLSFTMFLLILTDYLPNIPGPCSPLIRYHFCFCLFVLVLSMLVSMVCTKVATDGNFISFKLPKLCKPENGGAMKFVDMATDGKAIEKIVDFVEKMDDKEKQAKKKKNLANKLDKISFWVYLWVDIIYGVCSIVVFNVIDCKVNNDIW
ncbi:5-hydroxytryptamine receptor 3A-like [Trichomycterus rosablanca]|uniref:5-hydroxytryptamine receptor 3A-like n=1 Tax=Trichomycterus rosablanca TaxID=2290929 RepID=UPI002F36120E